MTREILNGKGPLYLPTRVDPAINRLCKNACAYPACGAEQKSLWPIQSAEREGIYAIMCDCRHIGGDAKSVADAISTWNGETRARFDKNPM